MDGKDKETLFTIGYGALKSRDELVDIINGHGAVLVDCRYQPYSQRNEFNKRALSDLMGSAYVHVHELGNVNYKGGPVKIEDLEAGLSKLRAILERGPAILMCMCSNLGRCHRMIAADALEGEGYAVVHLRQPEAAGAGAIERQAELEVEAQTPLPGAGLPVA